MACRDLAGKAWGFPCWQMLGGKFRDKMRVYSDTTFTKDPVEQGRRLKDRMDRGFTFLKMDLPITLLEGIEGALTWPGWRIWFQFYPGTNKAFGNIRYDIVAGGAFFVVGVDTESFIPLLFSHLCTW